MNRHIRVATCNFELNGNGSRSAWERMHQRLRGLNLDLLLRQEMVGCAHAGRGSMLWYESEQALGMRGFLGQGMGATALYIDPNTFTPVRNWADEPLVKDIEQTWHLPPTVLSLQLDGTTIPIICASFHHSYKSPAARELEAQWLTGLNDKRWTLPNGRLMSLPCVAGCDTNSYPETGTSGDPALPVLENIADKPHRAHRSRLLPDGTRVMDTRPDNILRTAGLEDVARYLAERKKITAPVARTVDACDTHGPDARIDRIYLSDTLLEAVDEVEIIDMSDLSDHHTVVLSLDRAVLMERLSALAMAA